MIGMRRFALVMVVTALAGAALAAREGRRRRGRGREPAEDLFDVLVRECKLTDKQKTDVKAKIKARDEALAKWDKANAEKVQAAEAAAKDARSNNDADARKKTSAELRALRTARQESGTEATAVVLAVLTPKQKAAWGAYELYMATIGRYRRAQLTEEQLARIKGACAFAAKELGEIDETESKAKRAKNEISKKLRWAIDVFVLTPEQRDTLGQKPGGGGRKRKNQ